ncbi:phosphonoacetate hydrolase [Rhodobium orientis]|uniref:Phosphonoacetate hydrolase n=1 Tax=Rhodobium orientis TaxID=34017 RepID=A0A327K378_9HYPH|nr:phosphonoacetate hydrolase [Rhodobium orientis]MBB4302795.1 phosphonoacetate hydrolase [Rhodobium orientis]MBK5948575.1 phosphonoacetate hydrolase [Rhodobium orientis]RAI29838.1 phosphonoacetate hydrolase [Rhodobium orientis]
MVTTVPLHEAASGDATDETGRTVSVNGRTYRLPRRPLVLICFDGCDPAYLETAVGTGLIPTIDRMGREGFAATALSAMPSFTNPNNLSVVCGAPPSVHGVAGNYYLDRETGETVMMTDTRSLKAPTVLAALAREGVATAVVTAKDKLRQALALDLDGISVSAECADKVDEATNGIASVVDLLDAPLPDRYSPELSLYVLDLGLELLRRERARLLYLSLSDYVQHRHAPGAPEADAFLAAVDRRLAAFLAAGADIAIIADHGMTDMAKADGTANVVFVADEIEARFGEGAARVICPITDPFVRHHGALGGLVRVHVTAPELNVAALGAFLADIPGIERVLPREEAARVLETPWEAEADFVLTGEKGVALGSHEAEHDLTALAGERLRSHGGFHEQRVPFLLSRPLRADYREKTEPLRNFDVLDFALNGTE